MLGEVNIVVLSDRAVTFTGLGVCLSLSRLPVQSKSPPPSMVEQKAFLWGRTLWSGAWQDACGQPEDKHNPVAAQTAAAENKTRHVRHKHIAS